MQHFCRPFVGIRGKRNRLVLQNRRNGLVGWQGRKRGEERIALRLSNGVGARQHALAQELLRKGTLQEAAQVLVRMLRNDAQNSPAIYCNVTGRIAKRPQIGVRQVLLSRSSGLSVRGSTSGVS